MPNTAHYRAVLAGSSIKRRHINTQVCTRIKPKVSTRLINTYTNDTPAHCKHTSQCQLHKMECQLKTQIQCYAKESITKGCQQLVWSPNEPGGATQYVTEQALAPWDRTTRQVGTLQVKLWGHFQVIR